MTRFEYSDFHKFIVSLGTGLVVLAFTIPWVFLRESFEILIKEDEIAEFPQKVQTISVVFIILPLALRNNIGENRLNEIRNRYEIQIQFISEEDLNDIELEGII